MAATSLKPANTNGFGRLLETVAERLDTALNGRLTSALKSSTALSQTRGIFDSNPKFGVNFAMESTATRDWTKAAADFARFTIDEARERLAGLIDGDFFIDTFQDLVSYLKDRSLALESRIFQGNSINYLVDTRTKQAVQAAQVHPMLSRENVRALEMRGSLRRVVGPADPADAFGNWQGMSMLLDQSSDNLAYTVSGDQGYFGKRYDVATANADENMAIIRRARSEGVELILPHRPGHNAADLIPGMPILRASKSMKAEAVHPSLNARNLTATFGQTMFDQYEEAAKKNAKNPAAARAAEVKSAEVVSFEDFKARYVKSKHEVNEFADTDADGFGFGGLPTKADRNIALRRGADMAGSLAVWDLDLEEELAVAPNCLPLGEYVRLDVSGAVEGYSVVGDRGSLRHLDRARKPVKEFSASQSYQDNEEFSSAMQMRLK